MSADIPLKQAVAGVRVGLLPDAGFVVNPTVEQMATSKLDLVIMTPGTDSAVLMLMIQSCSCCSFFTTEQRLDVRLSSAGFLHAWIVGLLDNMVCAVLTVRKHPSMPSRSSTAFKHDSPAKRFSAGNSSWF